MTPRALYDLVIPGVTVVEVRDQHGGISRRMVWAVIEPLDDNDSVEFRVPQLSRSSIRPLCWPREDESDDVLTRLWPHPGDEPIVLENP